MKQFIVIVIIISCPLFLNGQENQFENAIKKSLELYIKEIKIYQSRGIKSSNYFDDLLISIDNFPPNFNFDAVIDDTSINYISLINYKDSEKRLKKGIWLIILNSIILDKNKLRISFAHRYATLKNKDLRLEVTEWAHFTYEYFCAEEKWILTDSNFIGI